MPGEPATLMTPPAPPVAVPALPVAPPELLPAAPPWATGAPLAPAEAPGPCAEELPHAQARTARSGQIANCRRRTVIVAQKRQRLRNGSRRLLFVTLLESLRLFAPL